jgi:hypothetical protein
LIPSTMIVGPVMRGMVAEMFDTSVPWERALGILGAPCSS